MLGWNLLGWNLLGWFVLGWFMLGWNDRPGGLSLEFVHFSGSGSGVVAPIGGV
jgi:hypothetical protein